LKLLDKSEELNRLRRIEEYDDGQSVRDKLNAMAARWEAEQARKKAAGEK
jgi:hypothetical protein